MTETGLRIGLVGHCGFDAGMLRGVAERALPGARVEAINRGADLEAGGFDLLLVNRVLDGRFTAGDGIELINRLGPGTKTMLISNYPEAQATAESAGALPGFGKAEASRPIAAERIRAAVGLEDHA